MKNAITIILFLFITIQLFSQKNNDSPPDFVDPTHGNEMVLSPDVTAFHTYNFTDVNLYTGRINLVLPLYEINTGNIQVPISISYNSGGIKVEDVASCVGLGWNLNAGGSIAREIKDVKDSKFISYNKTYDMNQFKYYAVLGYHRLDEKASDNCNDHESLHIGKMDGSPDLFFVNAPGISNKFYLLNNGTDFNEPYLDREYKSIFLEKDNSSMGLIQREEIDLSSHFGFTGEEDGNPGQNYWTPNIYVLDAKKYDFKSFGINRNGLNYTFNSINLIETRNLPVKRTFFGASWFADQLSEYDIRISSWKLDEIYDITTNKFVNFYYETYQREQVNPIVNLKGRRNSVDESSNCTFDFFSYTRSGGLPIKQINSDKMLIKYPKLNRIDSISWQEGSIEFIYGKDRIDAIGEKALTEIKVKNKDDQIIKHYKFSYTYFSKNGCHEAVCHRLKLDTIKEVNNIGEEIVLYTMDYEYTNPLPKRTSLQRDFLGYYNNNGETYEIDNDNFEEDGPMPELYFYENQGRYSCLPFSKNNVTATHIFDGDYSLIPNSYSLTGLLEKITYPLGGYSEYEYENHQFYFEGNEYIAGGARIKKQYINDGLGNERYLTYTYETATGVSSGSINNIPVFGYPSECDFTNPTTYDKYKSGLELTDGNFIGYSRIIETELNNGFTEYIYSSPEIYPNIPEETGKCYTGSTNFLLDNSGYPGLVYVDNEIRRNRLLYKRIYDNNNDTLKQIKFDYDYKVYDSLDIKFFTKVNTEPEPAQGPVRNGFLLKTTSQINTERNVLASKETTDYFNGGSVVKTEEYVYHEEYPFIKEKIESGLNDEIKSNLYYPMDSEVAGEPYMTQLTNMNRIHEPIKSEVFKVENNTEKLLNSKKYNYHDFGNDLVLIKSLSISKGNFPLEEEGTIIDSRDEYGNITQTHLANHGVNTAILYGYNYSYPVLKVVGSTFNNVVSKLSVSYEDLQDKTTAELITIFSSLRNLPEFEDAIITNYTYTPLIGMTSETDQNGNTTYYEYDELNRLRIVKDQDGNILKKIEYNIL